MDLQSHNDASKIIELHFFQGFGDISIYKWLGRIARNMNLSFNGAIKYRADVTYIGLKQRAGETGEIGIQTQTIIITTGYIFTRNR